MRKKQLVQGPDHILANYFVERLKTQEDDPSPVLMNGTLSRYNSANGTWERVDEKYLFELMNEFPGNSKTIKRDVKLKTSLRLFIAAKELLTIMSPTVDISLNKRLENNTIGIAFTDGFLDLSNPSQPHLRPHVPTNYLIHCIPVKCPDLNNLSISNTWLETAFEKVWKFDNDKEIKLTALSEFIGATLLGIAPKYAKVFFFYGPTANNGKTVIIKVIEKLFNKNVTAISPQQWSREYDAAGLSLSLLNIATELPDSMIAASDIFKKVITGDRTRGRHPYGKAFEFVPCAGHLFSANDFPRTADLTEGFWRRWQIISFNRSIPESERDPPAMLDRLIEGSLPEIAKLAISGAIRALKNNKYTEIPSSKLVIEEWQLKTDQVAQFIKCCTTKPGGRGRTSATEKALYTSYKEWSMYSGHKMLSASTFYARLAYLKIEASTLSILRSSKWTMNPTELPDTTEEDIYEAN